jgi:DNA-binding IclR family transcriptional regulator
MKSKRSRLQQDPKPRKVSETLEGTERSSVRAVQRALRLLECCSEGQPTLALSQYARMADLPVSTAYRLLITLETAGFVRRNASGAYSCGTRLLQIGLTALQNVSAYDVAEPHLQRLSEMTGESAYLGIPADENQIIYVRQSLSSKAVRHSAWLGRGVPYKGTAIGAAMAGKVGERGFVMVRRTIEPDVTAIAAPIYGREGSITAAINVVGPSYRITDTDIDRFGTAVVDAARAISREIGARVAMQIPVKIA